MIEARRNSIVGAMAVMMCVAVAMADAPPAGGVAPVERPTTGELMRQNGGSLFRATLAGTPTPVNGESANGRGRTISFFAVPEAEPKTLKKHDLITIVIRESTEMNSESNSEMKKDADLDARLEEWPKVNLKEFQVQSGTGANPIGVRALGSRNFKGEAKVDRTDTFTTRIAAEVIDVKPNGTVALQARKFIKHGDEEQEYLLTGVCRAADITPDNSILSTQVHNLTVITNTKGAVTDTTKRGFIPKLLDSINPF